MEDVGLFGLEESTVSLICGVSVLFVVLVIVALGVIGFFINVRWLKITHRLTKIVLFQTLKARREFSEETFSTRESAISITEDLSHRCSCGENPISLLFLT